MLKTTYLKHCFATFPDRWRLRHRTKQLARLALSSTALIPLLPQVAHAEQYFVLPQMFTDGGAPTNLAFFALFVGAFSFAMMAATWLIRERRRLEKDHELLSHEHSDLKARHEMAQALLSVPDQRVVVWSSWDQTPRCRGDLPASIGAPQDVDSFLLFDTWLAPESAGQFEQAVTRLRDRAEGFELTLASRNGSQLEVQGRASGAYVFVRFIDLAGPRAALASLEAEHTALLQTTDTMKSLLEAVPMPVWLRDSHDMITWANPAYVAAVDADNLDQVCNNNIQLLDAANRQSGATQLTTLLESSEIENLDHSHRRLPATVAGDRRILDVNEVSYAGGSAGMAVDMSEVEEAQAKLRRTIDSHSQTMNQLATAVAIFDSSRRLIFYNQAFQSLWNLTSRDLEDEPDNAALFDLLRAEGLIEEQPDWGKWRDAQLQVYSSTQPKEHWWHLPDGRTLRVVANPHDHGGATWVFENITERLELESRYIALTQVQGETLDHLNEAIAVFASDGHLKLSNPPFQELWSLAPEQVTTEAQIVQIASQAVRNTVEADVWDQLKTGITGVADKRETIAGRLNTQNGKTLDFALVPLPQGQSLLTFVDVTASVQMEEALTQRNEALEAAEQIKNAFIEHVSYAFRAPLTNIKGFADMLEQELYGPLNEKQREYVGHINSSSMALQSMVENMLDLATVDAGIMELNLEKIDLAETVKRAVKSVTGLLKEHGLTLSMRLPPKRTEFVADANRIQQVLYNLLTNAIQFSPKGGEIIIESLIERDEVALRVSDAGPGVPMEKQETIFNRFESRVQPGSKRGAGLGLSIARSLVELHSGVIELDTSVEKGACFVCRFPRTPLLNQAVAAE